MRARRPHYFLRTQAAAPPAPPRWAFSLQAGDQAPPITASDVELDASWERLQLLAVVRGLEALPEPALVTLSTASDVVRRGIRHGLEEWREFDWQLEHFGELIPVKNADLWKRIDRALAIHDVQIRQVRVDEPIVAEQAEQPHFVQEASKARRAQTVLSGSGKMSGGHACLVSERDSDLPKPSRSKLTAPQTPCWDDDSAWDVTTSSDDLDEEVDLNWSAQISGSAATRQRVIKKTTPPESTDNQAALRRLGRPKRPFLLLRCRRRMRASLLHVLRRTSELWDSWLWFYEASGLPELTRPRKPRPAPWLRDQQHYE